MTNAHTLISVQTMNGSTLHGYVICAASKRDALVNGACSKMLDVVEDEDPDWAPIFLPLFLSTPLSEDGCEVVHSIINHRLAEMSRDRARAKRASEQLQKTLDGKEQFYFIAFMCPSDCADNERLMELH